MENKKWKFSKSNFLDAISLTVCCFFLARVLEWVPYSLYTLKIHVRIFYKWSPIMH